MHQEKLSERVNKKDFHVELKGYNAMEVDQYLDSIVSEIAILEKEVEDLNQKINEQAYVIRTQEGKLSTLNLEITSMKANNNVSNNSSSNLSNIDVFNRLSSIEGMLQKLLEKQK